MIEEWRNITVGVVDIGYQVSNHGRVRMNPLEAFSRGISIFRQKPIKAHSSKGTRGYKKVKLPLPDGSYRWFYVHLLVMEYFGPPKPGEGYIVDHNDTNKRNCRLDNLEWVTYSENTLRAYQTGCAKPKRGTQNAGSKLNERQVREIRRRHASGTSKSALAKLYGVSRKLIYNIVNRKAWAHV